MGLRACGQRSARAVYPARRQCDVVLGCLERLGGQPAPCSGRFGPIGRAVKAEALATVRFEAAPGQQLQIDFGERLVAIGGRQLKAFVLVANARLLAASVLNALLSPANQCSCFSVRHAPRRGRQLRQRAPQGLGGR